MAALKEHADNISNCYAAKTRNASALAERDTLVKKGGYGVGLTAGRRKKIEKIMNVACCGQAGRK